MSKSVAVAVGCVLARTEGPQQPPPAVRASTHPTKAETTPSHNQLTLFDL